MGKTVRWGRFEWDEEKSKQNQRLHGLSLKEATEVFKDPLRVTAYDEEHSKEEERFYMIGLVSEKVATVRFTYRGKYVRLFGAGYWRRGRKLYEKEKNKRS